MLSILGYLKSALEIIDYLGYFISMGYNPNIFMENINYDSSFLSLR